MATTEPLSTIDGTSTSDDTRSRPVWIRVLLASAAGLATAIVGSIAWFLVRDLGVFAAGWLAVPIGIAIGAAVAIGGQCTTSRRGSGVGFALIAVIMTFVASVLGQNFVQRDQLQTGIAVLSEQWASLTAPTPADPATEAPALERPLPPPDIAPLLPVEALLTIPPVGLAQIWEYVLPETKAQLPAELVSEVDALVASGSSAPAEETTDDAAPAEPTSAEATEEQAELDGFDIPRPVLECAPPPDFTQPTAAAGLGFPDGVPLLLPLSDYYRTAPPRGDGQDVDPPSPVCFAVESARDDPLEAAFWLLGAIGAAATVLMWRRRTVRAEPATAV